MTTDFVCYLKRHWAILTLLGGLAVWGARLESEVRFNKQVEAQLRVTITEMQKDLIKVKEDVAFIRGILE